jgi:hypothetical protein
MRNAYKILVRKNEMTPIHRWNNGTNKMDLTEILISFDKVDQR